MRLREEELHLLAVSATRKEDFFIDRAWNVSKTTFSITTFPTLSPLRREEKESERREERSKNRFLFSFVFPFPFLSSLDRSITRSIKKDKTYIYIYRHTRKEILLRIIPLLIWKTRQFVAIKLHETERERNGNIW